MIYIISLANELRTTRFSRRLRDIDLLSLKNEKRLLISNSVSSPLLTDQTVCSLIRFNALLLPVYLAVN